MKQTKTVRPETETETLEKTEARQGRPAYNGRVLAISSAIAAAVIIVLLVAFNQQPGTDPAITSSTQPADTQPVDPDPAVQEPAAEIQPAEEQTPAEPAQQ